MSEKSKNIENNGLNVFAMHTEQSLQALESITSTPFEGWSISKLDSESAARHYIDQGWQAESLPTFNPPSDEGQHQLKCVGVEKLELTKSKVVKFRQIYKKVPVYGSLISVELEENNGLIGINSAVAQLKNINPIATLSPTSIIEQIKKLAGYSNDELKEVPRLYFYYDSKSEIWRLVYITEDVRKYSMVTSPVDHFDYVIDAHTGELVAEIPRVNTVLERGTSNEVDELGEVRKVSWVTDGATKFLIDEDLRVATYDLDFQNFQMFPLDLPGENVKIPPDPWDVAAISAHVNASEVVLFLRETLKRNGVDNRGSKLISSIRCIGNDSSGKEWRNAAWVRKQMVYGQRLINGTLRSYSVAKDIVAHEIFHGITQSSADLQYIGISGALNESYSDIFGIIISNFARNSIAEWNWEMGEDLQGTGIPIRDLRQPSRFNQPEHIDEYRSLAFDQDHDWGGVHINSGIHNRAAYLMMTAKNEDREFFFTKDELAGLFYLALTQRLSKTSTFVDSLRAITSVAQTLFRSDPLKEQKVSAISTAFKQVGIEV